MNDSVYIAMIGNAVTLLVAIGGWVFSYFVYRDGKKIATLEKRVKKYTNEIKARIFLEDAACKWISEKNSIPYQSIKNQLRAEVMSSKNMRPEMSESSFSGN